MARRYESGLSNLSYTAKDFNAIYNELLDLADRISKDWKPSESDESDPGAVLLKLDAIIGDKNNYNIDKNILELFPSSVTQTSAAREIFDQCGYTMPYYRAAEVEVSLNMTAEPDAIKNQLSEYSTDGVLYKKANRLYTIPDFTQITNSDNSIVYTIVSSYPYVTSNGSTYHYIALEGLVKDYIAGSERLITYDNLDYNNRLYFKETNIAENGIFIQNVKNDIEQKNYTDWKKVSNLMTEPLNTRCYKFGVSKDGSRCYIEFPNDVSNLIGQGLKIKYITTNGYAGNIGSNTLNSIFNDTIDSKISLASDTMVAPALRNNSKLTAQLDNKLIYIRNIKPSQNGRNPETIEEAYKNYERVKNTFETLVSLRDYNNFVLTSDAVGNGFVCDRSNDIQSTTKIVTTDGNIESIYTQYGDDLNAFNLRLYALKYINPVNTDVSFDLSFDLATPGDERNLKDDMEEIKCIQHDFKDLNSDEIINIQLRYPIKAKIIPYNKLDSLQQLEVQSNISKTLYATLNANNINYGEELNYDDVYDAIMQSDNRIKSLILDDFDYEAWIIYKDAKNSDTPAAIKIDPTDTSSDLLNNLMNTIKAKAILAGVTRLFEVPETNFNYSILHTGAEFIKDVGKVTTNSSITATLDSNNTAKIVLTPNESIYLSAPNYITKYPYANNVKYFYKLNTTLPANSIYKLSSDEFIAFFYMKDSNDTAYWYEVYKEGSIISPNFSIDYASTSAKVNALSTSTEQNSYVARFETTLINNLEDHGQLSDNIEYDIPDYRYPDGAAVYKVTLNNLIKECDVGTILDGTKSIDIKQVNKITFGYGEEQKNCKLYWVLNSTTLASSNESYYVLFEEDSTSYTLKTGEYLFYTDSAEKTFSMLGAGTKLVRPNAESGQIRVKAKSYEEILYGTNTLLSDEDLWYTLPSDTSITATEMMFYNIGSGSTITFKYIGTDTGVKSLTLSSIDTSVKDYDISYRYEGNDVRIPRIAINDQDSSWQAHTILNLNCGPDKEQILYDGPYGDESASTTREQSITPTYKLVNLDNSNTDFDKINNADPISKKIIQSNFAINILGGTNIDVTAYDITGARYNNAFYSYSTSSSENMKAEGFNVEVELPAPANPDNTKTLNVNINLPKIPSTSVGYLLPILTYKDYKTLNISTSSECKFRILNVLDNQGLKFIVIYPTSTSTSISLKIDYSDTGSSRIKFLPLMPYLNEDSLGLADTDKKSSLIDKIEKLDPQKKFNYAHVVDDSKLIEDPLDPIAFLDPNHPYNKATICRWNYKQSKVAVTNKIK